jgi:hypothetical protein
MYCSAELEPHFTFTNTGSVHFLFAHRLSVTAVFELLSVNYLVTIMRGKLMAYFMSVGLIILSLVLY